MRRMLQILLLAAVLWAGMHPAEPAMANEETHHHELEAGIFSGEEDPHEGAQGAAHAGHHHCPVATCDAGPAHGIGFMSGAMILFAAPIAALGSLSQAPPLEPPAT